jgi:hypothetical protein
MRFRISSTCGRVATYLLVACALLTSKAAYGQDRGSFTALLTLGYGLQSNAFGDETGEGLSGLSFGIGGFVNRDFALMFRLSGSNVDYEFANQIDNVKYNVVSGVGVLDGQFWLTDRLNFEAGAGFGFASYEDEEMDDTGLGLFAGAGYSILLRGKFSLQVGVEYAPVFLDEFTVHNIGFNVGFQFL